VFLPHYALRYLKCAKLLDVLVGDHAAAADDDDDDDDDDGEFSEQVGVANSIWEVLSSNLEWGLAHLT